MTVYNTSIPDANHRPSVDQPLMQANFNILNQTVGANHVPMTDATVANRGKHNLVTFIQQNPIPAAPGVKTESKLYGKRDTADTITAPAYRTLNGTYSIPIVIDAGDYATINGTVNTYNFATSPQPAMMGWVLAVDTTSNTRTLFSPFFWDGASLSTPGSAGQLAAGITLVKFNSAGSILTVQATAVLTVRIKICGIVM